jgi:hypothetical protein
VNPQAIYFIEAKNSNSFLKQDENVRNVYQLSTKIIFIYFQLKENYEQVMEEIDMFL